MVPDVVQQSVVIQQDAKIQFSQAVYRVWPNSQAHTRFIGFLSRVCLP